MSALPKDPASSRLRGCCWQCQGTIAAVFLGEKKSCRVGLSCDKITKLRLCRGVEQPPPLKKETASSPHERLLKAAMCSPPDSRAVALSRRKVTRCPQIAPWCCEQSKLFCFHLTLKDGVYFPTSFLFLEGHGD